MTKLQKFATKLMDMKVSYEDGLELLQYSKFKLIEREGGFCVIDSETVGSCYSHIAPHIHTTNSGAFSIDTNYT